MDAGREPVTEAGDLTAAATEEPAPRAEDMPLPTDPQTIFLGALCLLAVLTVLKLAQAVVLPLVIAIILKLLLQPVVRLLERVRVPRSLGAVVALLLLLGVFAGLGGILSGPAARAAADLPNMVARVERQFSAVQALGERVQPFLDRFGIGGFDPFGSLMPNIGGLAGSVAGSASGFASHLLETLLVLFYLLVFGEVFMRRLVEILPGFREKRQAVEISMHVERDIGAYLLTITLVNGVVGVLAGLMMWAFGVPGAAVWGVIAFAFNYVPIIGPFAGVGLFAIVGLATLGAAWTSLLPAAGYLLIHFAEGEVITPMLLARRFTLNPIAVIIALLFWYWMWGVQGAILSVPLLAVCKIVSDRLRPFRALGHLLQG